MADRFYIGMIDDSASMQTSLKPYAIPDNAFAELYNAFVFRGRLTKRAGSQYLIGGTGTVGTVPQLQSRLRYKVGTVNANPWTATISDYKAIGTMFSAGNILFTVYQSSGAMLVANGTNQTGTFNVATGALSLSNVANGTDVYYYPSQPVVGLITQERSEVNNEDIIAFDPQYSYRYGTSGWDRLDPATTWRGNNSQYFWGCNARNVSNDGTFLFVTNFNGAVGQVLANADPIRWLDPATDTWTNFQPSYSSTTPANVIVTAKVILVFKSRLILLNTVENTGANNLAFISRCRYSWIGDFTNNGAPNNPAFYDDQQGGYLDIPTREAIITAQFLKDRLIVYCEQSTWELVNTGNQVDPFIFQQINTELGAESTFSQVPFDKAVLGVGNVGIVACNGYNVERIDNKIPTTVFEIHNVDQGPERVFGIRDYFNEVVYWSYPSTPVRGSDYPFNNRILVYNYSTASWAFYEDSITVFGYFQGAVASTSRGLTWGECDTTWDDADFIWGGSATPPSTTQPKFRQIIAGNQQGYTFVLSSNVTSNAAALQITNITVGTQALTTINVTCYNHNLDVGSYVKLTNCGGITSQLNNQILVVDSVTDKDNIVLLVNDPLVGTYSGGGVMALVTPVDILTKQYNFYANKGYGCSVNKIDFLVDRTDKGEFTVDYYTNSSTSTIGTNGNTNGLLGTNIVSTRPYALAPLESFQERIWHPMYPIANGSYIQLRLYLTPDQILATMTDPSDPTKTITSGIAESAFELHAMVIHARPTTSRLQ